MNHSRFLPPPVRLSQAFEGETGGDGISRRTFIKRTGGATVATMVAWSAAANRLWAGDDESEESASKAWKKRKWTCRLVIGPGQTDEYTESELQALDIQWSTNNGMPFGTTQPQMPAPLQGSPEALAVLSGPVVLETWAVPEPLYVTGTWREPHRPTLQDWVNPEDNKHYPAYIWEVYQQKDEFEPPVEP